jgi:hypothetical protein
MTEEQLTPTTTNQETPSSERAEQLLQRQQALQEEARTVLEKLDLITMLRAAGTLRVMGSFAAGLMVWRDLDLSVSSHGLSIERAYEIMRPLFIHPRVKQIRYLHQSGEFKENGLDERHFFMVYYDLHGHEWKLDISFWLAEGIRPEPLQDFLEQQLTPDARLTILQIKDAWYQHPAYRIRVSSTDIYDAVLHHAVRTLTEFDQYLVQRGKPTHADR